MSLKSKLINNFGIETFAKYISLNVNENHALPDVMDRCVNIWAFRGGIYYMPPLGKGKDKIFMRFTNSAVFGDRKQDFSQLQVGFTKALDF